MSLFLDFRCQNATILPTIATAWSTKTKPCLAVATADGLVQFYTPEGELIPDLKVKRGCAPSVLSWGPAPFHLLAIGWSDGGVSLYDEAANTVRDDTTIHKTDIRFLLWSPDGSRLISGCSKGVVGVWKTDTKAAVIPILQHRRDGTAAHCVFRIPSGQEEQYTKACPAFFFGGESGTVCLANDKGLCKNICELRTPIASIMYNGYKDQVVVITNTMMMSIYQLNDEDKAVQVGIDLKLSATSQDAGGKLKTAWVGNGVLATVAQESLVRFWNTNQEDNYVLSLADYGDSATTERLVCLSYHSLSGLLAAGTVEGRVLIWRNGASGLTPTLADWSCFSSVKLQSKVNSLHWGGNEDMLAVCMSDAASVLAQVSYQRKVKCGIAVVQTSATRVNLEAVVNAGATEMIPIEAPFRIKGADHTGENLVVWSGREVQIFSKDARAVSIVGRFDLVSNSIAIYNQHLYAATNGKVEIINFSGTPTGVIALTTAEGSPLLVDVADRFLAVFTSQSLLKIFDISRREPRLMHTAKFEEGENKTLEVASIRVNYAGTRVSVLSKCRDLSAQAWVRNRRIYVYDVELESFLAFDCGNRVAVSHYWDAVEHRLLCAQSIPSASTRIHKVGEVELSVNASEIITIFATTDMGLKEQNKFPVDATSSLLGLSVPYIYVAVKDGIMFKVSQIVMRDFIGMENVDEQTRAALLDFSYKLTIGNMDEAYKAVKSIKSSQVWDNMAHMCVKTKQLEIAEACLGNMQHARGARCLRMARNESEPEAVVAMVALQIGMTEDAERLYHECGRYDLLNQMYQSMGQWKKAIEVAEKKDRIHLRTTHFNEARYYESIGNLDEAARCYEAAGCHVTHVPRMFWENNAIQQLENYIKSKDDKELYRWWGRFNESNAALDVAMEYYKKANDNLSLVRLLCFRGEFGKAEALVNDTKDPLAAYHLATQYELNEKYAEAIRFFADSGRFTHAARLARDAGLDDDLWRLALQAPSRVMLETAQYFESKGKHEKAVLLYQKSGSTSKALSLCFQAKLFDALRSIADDLSTDTDPALLARVGDFLMENKQYEKSVHLLITAKQFDSALDLCLRHSVKISEEMAEKMTECLPTKEQNESERNRVLQKIAKVAKKQGNFHLATKKYTQAGLKVKAMKSLLKSGDTEKIIFFAGILKQAEIYVMAANYLQALDWHNNADIMKSIIAFYTKAKAFINLASFFESCSQVEIDEYRDYEKALSALKEAHKYCTKAQSPDATRKANDLEQRIRYVEAFVAGRKLVMTNPDEMVSVCYRLLDQPNVESAIRVGDVFALLIEWYFSQGDFKLAYQLIIKMQQRNIILGPYLDHTMVEKIYQANGIDTGGNDDGMDDEIAEDI